MTALLVVLAVAFAFSMGAHYTGACMGMPRALGALSTNGALLLMAPLTLLGAAVASRGVEATVGHGLLTGPGLSVAGLVIVVGVAFGLTTAFTALRLPTSTIQILVFAVVGAGLAAGTGVHWATIGTLAVIWVSAPPAAAVAGFGLTRLLDRIPSVAGETGGTGSGQDPTAADAGPGRAPDGAADTGLSPGPTTPSPAGNPVRGASGGWLAGALVAVGALASFAMGGNDVANATGSLVGTNTLGPEAAALVGGAALAAGVLTWGRPLLRRIAFEIVTVDRPMAAAAQLVQAAVVLAAVAFGYFTSMNQALIGAMAGAGAARGRHTVHAATLLSVVRGWVIGPGAAILLAYVLTRLVAATAGAHTVVAADP